MTEESGPKKKKQRISLFGPFAAPGLALSASDYAAAATADGALRIEEHEIDETPEVDEVFFPDITSSDSEDWKDIQIQSKTLPRVLKTNVPEERLRNAVFTELVRQGSQFPPSAINAPLGLKLRNPFTFLSRDSVYQEAELKTILNEHPGSQHGGEAISERMLRGLKVTTTSKPDLTVVKDGKIFFGEFKNKAIYDSKNAIRQCSLYLMSLIYYYRVHCGTKVNSVFGFGFSGRQCSDQANTYAVILIRLSAPDTLDGGFRIDYASRRYKEDSVDGIRYLIRYLRQVRVEQVDADILSQKERIPALMGLPAALWDQPTLIRNGTTAIVFKGFPEYIRALFQEESIANPEIRDHFQHELQDARDDRYLYLKVRSKDTSIRANPCAPIAQLKSKLPDVYDEVYCTHWGDTDIGFFLMKDCGAAIGDAGWRNWNPDPDVFHAMFANLWERTLYLCEHLFHGDVLPHNVMLSSNDDGSKRFVLIDIDECHTSKCGDLPVRMLPQDVRKRLDFPNLVYPNLFRKFVHRGMYTQIQLVTTYLLITKDAPPSSQSHREALLEGARDLDQRLGSMKPQLGLDNQIHTPIIKRQKCLIKTMQDILKGSD